MSRVHTAIHNVNHGPGKYITGLCDTLGCPIIDGTRVSKALEYMQMRNEKHISYKNLKSTKRQGEVKGMKCLNCTQYSKSSNKIMLKTNCYLYIKCHALAYRWITGATTENADTGINFAAESPLFPCKSLQIQIIMYSFKPTSFVSYSK